MSQIQLGTGGSGGSGIETIDGDVGSVTGSTITLTGGSTGFTFNGSGMTMTMEGSATYYSLTPYIVGTDVNSQYSTIQDAITAASGSSANIYVKPGTYSDNFELTNGINIISLGGYNAVTISGTITAALSTSASISGCNIAGGMTISNGSANFNINNCYFSSQISVSSGATFTLTNCNIFSNFLAVSGSSNNVVINLYNSILYDFGSTVTGTGNNVQLYYFSSLISSSYVDTTGGTTTSLIFYVNNCFITADSALGESGSGDTISFKMGNSICQLSFGDIFTLGNSSESVYLYSTAFPQYSGVPTAGSGHTFTFSTTDVNGILYLNSQITTSVTYGGTGPYILVYPGSPSGSVTAPANSLCINSEGNSTTTRLFVNTTGSTTWAHVTTSA